MLTFWSSPHEKYLQSNKYFEMTMKYGRLNFGHNSGTGMYHSALSQRRRF